MKVYGMLSGKKTYVTAGLTVLGALFGVLTGDLLPADAIQLGVTAILGATIRHGVASK